MHRECARLESFPPPHPDHHCIPRILAHSDCSRMNFTHFKQEGLDSIGAVDPHTYGSVQPMYSPSSALSSCECSSPSLSNSHRSHCFSIFNSSRSSAQGDCSSATAESRCCSTNASFASLSLTAATPASWLQPSPAASQPPSSCQQADHLREYGVRRLPSFIPPTAEFDQMLSRFAEEHPPWAGMITSQHQGWFPINDVAAQHLQQPLFAGGGLPLQSPNAIGDGCPRRNGAFERSVCSPVIRTLSLTPSNPCQSSRANTKRSCAALGKNKEAAAMECKLVPGLNHPVG